MTGHLPLAGPVCQAEDALVLLRTGRTEMALRLLEGLPNAIRAAGDEATAAASTLASMRAQILAADALLADAMIQTSRLQAEIERQRRELAELSAKVTAKRRELGQLREPRPAPIASKPHQALAASLADGRITAERVAELLKLRPEDVAPIAAGRVGLAKSAWQRVLAALPREGRT